MTMLAVTQIVADRRAQLRARLDPDVIDQYVEAMNGRARFPALVVFHDVAEGVYYLADGFHRLEAARRVGRERVHVRVVTGNLRDAILYAARANAQHGLPRTAADKRRAVLALLTDLEWRQWSDREIARRCLVSDHFVARLRAEIEAPLPVVPEPTRMVRRGQVLYPMRIARRAKRERELPVNGVEDVGIDVLHALGVLPVKVGPNPGVLRSSAGGDVPVNLGGGGGQALQQRAAVGARPAISPATSGAQPGAQLPVSHDLEVIDLRERCFALEAENKHLRVLLSLAGLAV